MMHRLGIALALLAGCSPANWHRAANVSAALAAGALACDWGQTRSAAAEGWSGGRAEANPLMGPHPDVGTVDAYMAVSAGAIALVAAVTPPKWRTFLLGGIALVEAHTVIGNFATTRGVCGL